MEKRKMILTTKEEQRIEHLRRVLTQTNSPKAVKAFSDELFSIYKKGEQRFLEEQH